MPIPFSDGADFLGTALQNALMHPVGSHPSSPKNGQVWYRSDEDALYIQANGQAERIAFASEMLAGGVADADFDSAHSILVANTAGDPVALTVGASSVVGRDAAGNITALDAAALRAILNVEDGATGDQTGAQIKAAYEGEADTNAFTDADVSKLSGIEDGATGDQTAAEILALLLTVHGNNSGLDADLLDGMQASAFQTVAGMAAFATNTYVDTQISNLIGGAGSAFDTLAELEAALTSNDSDIASILTDIANNSNKAVATIGDGTATAITVTHDLNTLDCSVYVRSNVTNERVLCPVLHDSVNSVVVTFGTAPAVDEFNVIVQG